MPGRTVGTSVPLESATIAASRTAGHAKVTAVGVVPITTLATPPASVHATPVASCPLISHTRSTAGALPGAVHMSWTALPVVHDEMACGPAQPQFRFGPI